MSVPYKTKCPICSDEVNARISLGGSKESAEILAERLMLASHICKDRKINENLPWIDIKNELPSKTGTYLIHAPTADEKKPLILIAWYEVGGGKYEQGWSLIPGPFCDKITHWLKLIPPTRSEMR